MNSETAKRLLTGFMVAGVVLVTASWLITGERSVAYGLAPFALLWASQFLGKGQADAR